jgi:hypothetical protein
MEKAGVREVERVETGGRATVRFSLARADFQPGKELYEVHRA